MATKPKTPAGKPAPSGPSVVSLDSLALDPANLRERDDRARAGIEASLRRFGAGRSVVIDAKGMVIAGNGTIEAAREAGLTEVLVVEPGPNQLVAVRRDWTPTEATAYGIADNRLTDLSTFRQDDLAATVRALTTEGFDLEAIGFNGDEAERLYAAVAPAEGSTLSLNYNEGGAEGFAEGKQFPENFEVTIRLEGEKGNDEALKVDLGEFCSRWGLVYRMRVVD